MVGMSKNLWEFRNSDAISDLFWPHCVAFYVFLVVCHSFFVTMPASPYNLFFFFFFSLVVQYAHKEITKIFWMHRFEDWENLLGRFKFQ